MNAMASGNENEPSGPLLADSLGRETTRSHSDNANAV